MPLPNAARFRFAATLGLLALGLATLPAGWTRARAAIDSARSPELNRAEREASAGGYYEGLIGGGDGPEGARSELALRLMGKPTDWARFHAADVSRHLAGDFLQFELRPGVDRKLFGKPFRTNAQGRRGRTYAVGKPEGVYRIALLGSSMDMGWGVAAEETYASRLERWLNGHAARRGLARRFEVINFAVAAYGPLQRLESFRRKAAPYRPDLVVYSATMLDTRLMEIHLCDMFLTRVDLRYDFLRKAIDAAGIGPDDLKVDASGKLARKDVIKAKLRPHYWEIYDTTMGELAAECRSAGAPLACVIIPRVGKADAPGSRAEPLARLRGIAMHHGLPLYDLSSTFDRLDPSEIEIAAWDDHPNAFGHKRLFLALARALVKDRAMYETLFR